MCYFEDDYKCITTKQYNRATHLKLTQRVASYLKLFAIEKQDNQRGRFFPTLMREIFKRF